MTRLMIVDDDTDIRFLLATALRHAGYEVRTAADGFEALHMMSLQPPDLLLTDVGMPRLDGWRLLRLCRSQDFLADVPIIVMSAIEGWPNRPGRAAQTPTWSSHLAGRMPASRSRASSRGGHRTSSA